MLTVACASEVKAGKKRGVMPADRPASLTLWVRFGSHAGRKTVQPTGAASVVCISVAFVIKELAVLGLPWLSPLDRRTVLARMTRIGSHPARFRLLWL